VLFGVSVSVLATWCGAAQAADITVSLVPVAASIALDGPDDPLVLDVLISNPDQVEIRSWFLDLSYDPAVFDPLAGMGTVPTNGFEIGDYIAGVTPQWNPAYEDDGSAPDVAKMGALNLGSGTGSAVSGWLGSVTLDATGLSPGSILSLTGELLDPNSSELTGVQYVSTSITVIPEPATVALLLGAGAVLLRRRR